MSCHLTVDEMKSLAAYFANLPPLGGFMLRRQFSTFLVVGSIATAAHYTFLGLMHFVGIAAAPAALSGFVIGAAVNYTLNRRHTFNTTRTHVEAGWRFAAVATTGFCITWAPTQALTRGPWRRWSRRFLQPASFSFSTSLSIGCGLFASRPEAS